MNKTLTTLENDKEYHSWITILFDIPEYISGAEKNTAAQDHWALLSKITEPIPKSKSEFKAKTYKICTSVIRESGESVSFLLP